MGGAFYSIPLQLQAEIIHFFLLQVIRFKQLLYLRLTSRRLARRALYALNLACKHFILFGFYKLHRAGKLFRGTLITSRRGRELYGHTLTLASDFSAVYPI